MYYSILLMSRLILKTELSWPLQFHVVKLTSVLSKELLVIIFHSLVLNAQ